MMAARAAAKARSREEGPANRRHRPASPRIGNCWDPPIRTIENRLVFQVLWGISPLTEYVASSRFTIVSQDVETMQCFVRYPRVEWNEDNDFNDDSIQLLGSGQSIA
jgi:hypothetical protein